MKKLLVVAFLACVLPACGGGGGTSGSASEAAVLSASPTVITVRTQALSKVSNAALSTITITKLTKVSETRISRTLYDYVFKLTVNNAGNPATKITFALTQAGPGTTIIDGSSSADALAAGETADLPDTITLRHDRQIAFAPEALVWTTTIDASPTPPDLVGSDTDNDGVRDDVQAFINTKLPNDLPARVALLSLAKSYQAVVLSSSPAQLAAAEESRRDAAICLADRTSPATALELNASLRAKQLNTEARYAAELAFRDQLAGRSVVAELTSLGGTCK